ncbi:LPS O-antigen chain length determinant protein WzzB [Pseudomonas shirazensis]|uniref:LPS O-antigen chain length determinant protein WzzB n=1 Tax=Pseudomonas shirazensis TaxID=2745494 RepID=UPI0016449C70|nr:Wzz/FepE/Etk N-terminal domain-containing protein [Pseudomonas shirazensis]MBV4501041.1 hypothetical protein [Pseudomonas shirazensis]
MANEHQRRSGEGEIDLVDLMQGVWHKKIWIVLVALPIIGVSLLYVILAPPVYEAKLYIQPPSQNEIAQLNNARGGDSGLPTYSVKEVYEIYLKALQSEALRKKFFRSEYLTSLNDDQRRGSRDALYSQFNSLLKVTQAGKDMPLRYVVTANLEDPKRAAQWVTTYVEMASVRAKHEVLTGTQSDILIMANNLERQIMSAQAGARKQREDRIAQLEEALDVAESIGLKKPSIITSNLPAEVSAGMVGSLTYMRGSDALRAEIDTLKSRISDDPFIPELRVRQEKLSLYRSISVDSSGVSVYQQDGTVEQPDKPIKPRKALILFIATIIGVSLGALAAIGRSLWLKHRTTT